MAADKLIDSGKENACRTAEANAIRAKTGNTASITYDWANNRGFADAIAGIESIQFFSTFDGGVETENAYLTYSTVGSAIDFSTTRIKS